jgi:hypothetical protein
MKNTLLALFAPIVVLCAGFLEAANVHSNPSEDFTVHEWGTFTSVAGEDGNAEVWNALGSTSDLPRFVHDFGYRGLKLGISGTVRMETPVLYFYSSREVDAHVKVTFPQGLITEWYPQAEYEVHQNGPAGGSTPPLAPRNVAGCMKCHTDLNGIKAKLANVTASIEWSGIHVQPGTAPVLGVESEPSRYYAARKTDSSPVTVGREQEKFLFYRGVGHFAVPLSARVSDNGQVVIDNRVQQSVPIVILFENHEGRIGYRIAKDVQSATTLDEPALDASFPELRQVLETTLAAQGLFPKEAQAMVETWQDSWFEEGSRLIYITPSATVDAILPLTVEPVPSHLERVFVGRIELVTPETKRWLESAVARSDWRLVGRYNRFLDPILRRIYPGNPYKVAEIEQQALRNSQTSSEKTN